MVVLGSRVNTLRIERAASSLKGQPVSRDAFTLAQLNSLEKGFKIVDQVRLEQFSAAQSTFEQPGPVLNCSKLSSGRRRDHPGLPGRARSHCRFALLLIRFIQDSQR